jgi:hypothetical protein
VSDPVVHISNHSSRDVFIAPAPNWDDQVLLLDGRRLAGAHRLGLGESATLSVQMGPQDQGNEHMMGVIFADGTDYDYGEAGAYQLSIGQNAETGLLGVTDEYTIRCPAVQYAATDRTAWSMNIAFVDAPASKPGMPGGVAR